jgi:hypothetical protein
VPRSSRRSRCPRGSIRPIPKARWSSPRWGLCRRPRVLTRRAWIHRRATSPHLPTRRELRAARLLPPADLLTPAASGTLAGPRRFGIGVPSGEVAEWSKALAWKVSNIPKDVRGFESLPLRQQVRIRRPSSLRANGRRIRSFEEGDAGARAPAVPQRSEGTRRVAPSNPSLSANRVYGGSRRHLRGDLPRTPSGPEGSSGRGSSRAPKSR